MTVLWFIMINLWPSIVLICIDFREGEKPGVPGEKPSKHNCRDQLRGLSHMKCHTPGFVWVVRGTTR